MGLPKAEEVLREAMAMGADKGILVTDRVLGGADTWATSQTLAGAIRNLEYDLIITGRLISIMPLRLPYAVLRLYLRKFL